jgi:Uri superfamily endonuclease
MADKPAAPVNQGDAIPTQPGTYALLLRIAVSGAILIGQRPLSLTPGWAIYVGSAFGPGGLAGRLRHHRRLAVCPHWHIDYLRPYAALEALWYSADPIRRECLWAEVAVQALGGRAPPFRFGASDCRCRAHLYCFEARPKAAELMAALRLCVPDHAQLIEHDGFKACRAPHGLDRAALHPSALHV